MKNITIKKTKEYEEIWLTVEKTKPGFILWQVESEGERKIKYFSLKARDPKRSQLVLVEQSAQGEGFSLNDLYAYCEDLGFIFKTQVAAIQENEIFLSYPLLIKLLEDDDIKFIKGLNEIDFSNAPWRVKRLDVSEEEEVYTVLREAPRARPQGEKKVSLYKSGDADSLQDYAMFDISRGGLSFLVENEDQFIKGNFLEIVAVDGQELEVMYLGEVMSIRSHDSLWKIGVKFMDKIPINED